MQKAKFSIAHKDDEMLNLVKITDKKTLAVWAFDCAMRVLPFFKEKYPEDNRPQIALKTLKKWIETGEFSMSVIRKASLDAHAAAREAGCSNSSLSAARACGYAVATAHVKTHAYGSAVYAQQAISRTDNSIYIEKDVIHERDWQYKHLFRLRSKL